MFLVACEVLKRLRVITRKLLPLNRFTRRSIIPIYLSPTTTCNNLPSFLNYRQITINIIHVKHLRSIGILIYFNRPRPIIAISKTPKNSFMLSNTFLVRMEKHFQLILIDNFFSLFFANFTISRYNIGQVLLLLKLLLSHFSGILIGEL